MRFTAEDVEFILSVLGQKNGAAGSLVRLLADEEARDLILDNESLFRALLEQRGCLRVSCHFYFYVLVRHVFKRSGIEDRGVADYVAEVLAEYSRLENTRCVVQGKPEPLEHFFEMVAALQNVDDHTGFLIRTHIGNHSLFLSGIFPERIRYRAEHKGAPNLKYYEELGRANFRVASDHRLAHKYDLAAIFGTLSERFRATRLALNDLTERLFSLGDPDLPMSKLFAASGIAG
jgi:hypothetical protein